LRIEHVKLFLGEYQGFKHVGRIGYKSLDGGRACKGGSRRDLDFLNWFDDRKGNQMNRWRQRFDFRLDLLNNRLAAEPWKGGNAWERRLFGQQHRWFNFGFGFRQDRRGNLYWSGLLHSNRLVETSPYKGRKKEGHEHKQDQQEHCVCKPSSLHLKALS
jgi:hypothetical protein